MGCNWGVKCEKRCFVAVVNGFKGVYGGGFEGLYIIYIRKFELFRTNVADKKTKKRCVHACYGVRMACVRAVWICSFDPWNDCAWRMQREEECALGGLAACVEPF